MPCCVDILSELKTRHLTADFLVRRNEYRQCGSPYVKHCSDSLLSLLPLDEIHPRKKSTRSTLNTQIGTLFRYK